MAYRVGHCLPYSSLLLATTHPSFTPLHVAALGGDLTNSHHKDYHLRAHEGSNVQMHH